MTGTKFMIAAFTSLCTLITAAQPKKPVVAKNSPSGNDSLVIPISKAELGTFPYFKTLRNFYANDSINLEDNLVYFFDGKKYFTVQGKTSSQSLDIKNSNEKIVSEFSCIQEFDKVVTALGGIKVYTGKLPQDALKTFAGADIVALSSKSQLVPNAYEGVVEYVIKTPEKEVWVQLMPYGLASHFYDLLVVEKATPLLLLNTNKKNQVLQDLEKNKKATLHLSFEPDNGNLLSESKDELLSMVGIFQAHPDWKIKLECYSATVGDAKYTLALTEKRATALKQELMNLGVKNTSIDAKGMGDQNTLVPKDTEQGRITNTRIEILLQ